MDVFQNDLTILRCLLKRDFMGISAANLLNLGALSGLVHFFEFPHEEEDGWGGTDEEMREYHELLDQLRETWQQEIKYDMEMHQAAAKERRHLFALKTAEKRRINKAAAK